MRIGQHQETGGFIVVGSGRNNGFAFAWVKGAWFMDFIPSRLFSKTMECFNIARPVKQDNAVSFCSEKGAVIDWVGVAIAVAGDIA